MVCFTRHHPPEKSFAFLFFLSQTLPFAQVIYCTSSSAPKVHQKCAKIPFFPASCNFLLGALFFPPGFRGPRWPNGALGAHRTGFSGRSLRPHRADRTDQPRPDLRPRARSGTRLRPRRRTRLRRAGRGARLRRTRGRTRGAGGRTRRPTELVKAAAGITFHRASFLRRKRDADFRRQKARNPLYAGVRRRVSGGAGGSDSPCGVALVHYGLLAQRNPHPSASRPPSPSGKALATLYKLKCCIFL